MVYWNRVKKGFSPSIISFFFYQFEGEGDCDNDAYVRTCVVCKYRSPSWLYNQKDFRTGSFVKVYKNTPYILIYNKKEQLSQT